MNLTERLALEGGEPVVKTPPPHFTWPLIGKEEIDAVVNQLQTGAVSYFRSAGVVEEFEQKFAQFYDIPFAISTCSGTAALHAAFFSLALPRGAEVIAPSYTHLATVFPMLHVGLIPVLCDIDDATGNIDPKEIQKQITPRTRAIVVTHQYGLICDMEAICFLANKHNLYVIEDCSHAHGASYNGKLAGTFGDIACFSLQSHKIVWGGEGGILITKHPPLAERASLFAHFRQVKEYTSKGNEDLVASGYGLKNRLHPLAAALALVQLGKTKTTIEARKRNYLCLEQNLAGVKGVRLLATPEGADRGGFFKFLLKYIPEELSNLSQEKYVEALKAEGVSEITSGKLAVPVHCFPFFQRPDNGFIQLYFGEFINRGERRLLYKQGDFPSAERFSETTLQLPAFTEPSESIIEEYAVAMKKVAKLCRELK